MMARDGALLQARAEGLGMLQARAEEENESSAGETGAGKERGRKGMEREAETQKAWDRAGQFQSRETGVESETGKGMSQQR